MEELGTVRNVSVNRQSARIAILANTVLADVKLGDSIAVNGVCLTVTEFGKTWFYADVMPETMRRTSLGELTNGDRVNLERALRLGDRLGGHIVSGHIDGVGIIKAKQPFDNAVLISVEADPALLRYVVQKGSIALDGISLTVVDCSTECLSVSIIPHTITSTTLSFKGKGDKLNIETDMMAKYAEKILNYPLPSSSKGGISQEFLATHGFFD